MHGSFIFQRPPCLTAPDCWSAGLGTTGPRLCDDLSAGLGAAAMLPPPPAAALLPLLVVWLEERVSVFCVTATGAERGTATGAAGAAAGVSFAAAAACARGLLL
jgi:hypothetical protein